MDWRRHQLFAFNVLIGIALSIFRIMGFCDMHGAMPATLGRLISGTLAFALSWSGGFLWRYSNMAISYGGEGRRE